MTDINWTPDQRRSIETIDRSVVVSASAGSGKTAVLARRCAYLIADAPPPQRCDVDELLVVTFTEAAAAEMKSRIRERLRDRLIDDPRDERLRTQLVLLEGAHICTIHAFCLWVVRRWFARAGIDPSVSVLSAEQAQILRDETLELVVSARYDGPHGQANAFESLVDVYGLGRDGGIKAFVLRLAALLDSLPDPQAWLDRALDRYTGDGAGLFAAGLDWLARELAMQRDDARCVADDVSRGGRVGAFYGEKLRTHAESLARWSDAASQWFADLGAGGVASQATRDALDALCQEVGTYKLDARGAPRTKSGEHDESDARWVKDAFQGVRARFNRRLRNRIPAFSAQRLARDAAAIRPHVETLVELVRDFRSAHQDAKRRLDVMDFADQERLAFELLQDDDIAGQLRKRFRHVLVDEYQDVSPLQDAIIQRVSREADLDARANLFTVGDVKQSIYRFRLAEPKVLLDRIAHHSPPRDRPNAETRGEVVFLRDNYRSRPHVLGAVNVLFASLFQPATGGITYDADHMLRPGRSFDPPPNPPCVKLHLLSRRFEQPVSDYGPDDDQGNDADEPSTWEAVEREAFLIGEEILGLCDGTTALTGGKAVDFGDVAILLRAPRHVSDLMGDVLERMGIPTQGDTRGGMFDSLEIRDLRALLEILDNLQQDIPLATVLRSRILGDSFNETELLTIRYLDRDVPFHQAVRRYSIDGDDAALKGKLNDALRRIDEFRLAMRERPIPEALWMIYERTGYLAFVGGLHGGARRRANLLQFHNHARQFATGPAATLHRFVQSLEALDAGGRELESPPAVGQDQKAVRILSIHAAKGLEFPVVFLADLGRRFNLSDARDRMILDRDRLIGLRAIDAERMLEYPSAGHHLVSDAIERGAVAEELRILYVAMTRAQEHLSLVASTLPSVLEGLHHTPIRTDGSAVGPLEVESAGCPVDWVLSVLKKLPARQVAWDGGTSEALFRVVAHDAERIRAWRMPSARTTETDRLRQSVAQLAELPGDEPVAAASDAVNRVWSRLEFVYPHLSAASMRGVLAASEVKRLHDTLHDQDERVGEAPAWLTGPTGHIGGPRIRASSLRRGIATHAVLQRLDFAAAGDRSQLALQLDGLIQTGALSPPEIELIDVEAVLWFVKTPLGALIREAGDRFRREWMFVSSQPAQWFDESLGGDVTERVLVRGIVDGVLEHGDRIDIIDYKTDEVGPDRVSQRAATYQAQMQLYASSAARLWGRSVGRCRLVFLHPRAIIDLEP